MTKLTKPMIGSHIKHIDQIKRMQKVEESENSRWERVKSKIKDRIVQQAGAEQCQA